MASFGVGIEFAGRLVAGIDVQKSISNAAGKMKDSDWGVYWLEGEPWADQNTLDIYSESHADLEAWMIDLNLMYRIWEKPNWSFLAGVGYLYQNFDYETRNLDQWYPSSTSYFGVDFPHDFFEGTGVTYEVSYGIPYVGVEAEVRPHQKASISASIAYSPNVSVEDEDNHVLRGIIAQGNLDGEAIMCSFEGRYDFCRDWFFTLQLSYTRIQTDGDRTNFIDRVRVWTIDEETRSNQYFAGFSIGHSF